MHFPEQILALLGDMRAEAEQTSLETDDHWVRARSLHPDAAQMLYVLACATKAKDILEIGTLVGYSTLHLALAARQTGGHVSTLELMPAKVQTALRNVAKGGLTAFVSQYEGDALDLLPTLHRPRDLVFLDPEKELYVDVWALC